MGRFTELEGRCINLRSASPNKTQDRHLNFLSLIPYRYGNGMLYDRRYLGILLALSSLLCVFWPEMIDESVGIPSGPPAASSLHFAGTIWQPSYARQVPRSGVPGGDTTHAVPLRRIIGPESDHHRATGACGRRTF